MALKSVNRKAQTVVEVGILLAIVVGALMAMQVYVKRGIQGKIASTVDGQLGDAAGTEGSSQFEPPYYSSEGDSDSESNTTISADGEDADVTINATETFNRTNANETISGWTP